MRRLALTLLISVLAACSAAPPSPAPSLQASPPPKGRSTPAAVSTSRATTAISTAVPASPEGSGSSDKCARVLPELEGRIAFTVAAGASNGIAVVNADGSDLRTVVEPGPIRNQPHGGSESPRWMPDGRIVFSSNRAGGPDDWHIFSVDPSGGSPEQITSGPDGIEYQPTASADGTMLAYGRALATGDPAEPLRDAGIFVSNLDRSGERQVTTAPSGGADYHPEWSPDGSAIAFERVTDFTPGHGRSSIVVVDVDTREEREIVPPELNAIRASWSPDGELIAFSSNADSFDVESANVWVVAPDGSSLRQVTHATGLGQAYLPDWSPDGAWLVFVRHIAGEPGAHLAITSANGEVECAIPGGTVPGTVGDPDWGR